MLRDSLKYFFLTLITAGCVLAGILFLHRYSDIKEQMSQPPYDNVSSAAAVLRPGDAETVPPQEGTPGPDNTPDVTQTPVPTPEPPEARIARYISRMSMQEKIGQLVMFGFTGS